MRIQLSESIYDHLVKNEPKFVISERGLRNVLVSIKNSICDLSYAFNRIVPAKVGHKFT